MQGAAGAENSPVNCLTPEVSGSNPRFSQYLNSTVCYDVFHTLKLVIT